MRNREGHRGGLATIAVAVAAFALVLTAGITTGPGPSPADGAAAWVARERPAGPVLTVHAWGPTVADGDRLRVVTASAAEFITIAVSADPGSIVLPSDSPVIIELQTMGDWTVTYRDAGATVLVHEGALPFTGAT